MKLHKLYTLLLAAFCLTATSCIFDAEGDCPPDIQPGQTYKIQFVFKALVNTTRSITDPTLEGKNMENYIDLDNTKFFLFTNNAPDNRDYDKDTFLAELVPANVNGATPTWTVEAIISSADGTPLTVEQLKQGYKIVCIANAASAAPAAGTTLGNYLETLIYDYHSTKTYTDGGEDKTAAYYPFAGEADSDMRIPMYGVLAVSADKNYYPGIQTNVGDLHLLRAMSKIEIVFDETSTNTDGSVKTKDLDLTSATLNIYNNQGRVAPDSIYRYTQDWEGVQVGEVDNVPNTKIDKTVHVPTDATAATDVPFTVQQIDGKGRRAVLYVPEYNNIGAASDKKLEIHLVVHNTKTKKDITKDIYVCEYTLEGDPRMDNSDPNNPKFAQLYNLVRNYILTYKLSANNQFLYVVQVGMQSWQTVPGYYEVYNW